MLDPCLASKKFVDSDQAVFAGISGDYNPMHMNPIAARRTQAGAPVVHGIHAMLWALDKLYEADKIKGHLTSLNVQFNNFIYVGNTVILSLLSRNEECLKAAISQNGVTTTTIVLGFGVKRDISDVSLSLQLLPVVKKCRAASDPEIEEMEELAGRMECAETAEKSEGLFPHAAAAIGCRRIAAIACASRLVGMICPGLHSIFSGITLELVNESNNEETLAFRVTKVFAKRRIVRMDISGSGIEGSVLSFVRVRPVAQAPMSAITRMVPPNEFKGSTALIIGGSRGLGEVAAKIIAAGGGKVIVTYATGRDDAERVSKEIRSEVPESECEVVQCDVRGDIAKQLSQLKGKVTYLYYFATPGIFRQKDQCLLGSVLAEFIECYVTKFYECCRVINSDGGPLIAFYPSSVYAGEHPLAMTEYSMAKAAGEILCADMNRAEGGIRVVVSRLPRMLTDQTATVIPIKNADPLTVLLPIIYDVQSLNPRLQCAESEVVMQAAEAR